MKFGRTLLLGLIGFYPDGESSLRASVVRETTPITCRQGRGVRVQLRSTDRAPDATGEAKVERRAGATRVEAVVAGMKPASLFGGDYSTYVLWVVSPDGTIANLGEFILDGSRSRRLQAKTSLETFAILVTAEPHYLVSAPSAFVVLENKPDKRNSLITYTVLEGVYYFERGSLDDVKKAKGIVRTEVKQAFSAFRLAQRAGARELARQEFIKAERALDEMFSLLKRGAGWSEIAAQARETVRLAVAAQNSATRGLTPSFPQGGK